ncbi:MAG: alpha/beta hydrolase [Erysipelotrichales bacterium]|nr:alpha/beta hydrolase [Erysipelotrichales bacterium]
MKREILRIPSKAGSLKLIVLKYGVQDRKVPGILWIHGGGYETGMASMVYGSCGKMLAKKFGGIVVSPEYRLSLREEYPAALEDCYTALEYMYDHAEELSIDKNRIIVGGESAGGGLTAAVCLYARDQKRIPVAYQIPLYPMIDAFDTESSRNNHGQIWNTKRNHRAWKRYLGKIYGTSDIPKYASPSLENDYQGLPAAYTFVQDGEPFYTETLEYIDRLKEVGIHASLDVYHGDVHAFDLLQPWTKKAKAARKKLCDVYYDAMIHDFYRQ